MNDENSPCEFPHLFGLKSLSMKFQIDGFGCVSIMANIKV